MEHDGQLRVDLRFQRPFRTGVRGLQNTEAHSETERIVLPRDGATKCGRLIEMRCPLLAQSGHALVHRTCPLLGVKRTCLFAPHMSAFDPKRTSTTLWHCSAIPH